MEYSLFSEDTNYTEKIKPCIWNKHNDVKGDHITSFLVTFLSLSSRMIPAIILNNE